MASTLTTAPVSEPKANEICNHLLEGLITIGPKKYVFPKLYENFLPLYRNFPIKSDDVWMFGFPRSGTTLAQEMIWLIANDLDFEKAAQDVIDIRFPVLEADCIFGPNEKEILREYVRVHPSTPEATTAKKLLIPVLERLQTNDRRFIKAHSAISLMNPEIFKKGCKVFYLARNPKDVIVSSYHFLLTMRTEETYISFEEYWPQFRNGIGIFGPYLEHLKEGWNMRNEENVLFLVYDVYSKNIRETCQGVAKFLGKDLSDNDLDKLEEHLRVENFKNNKSVNNAHLEPFFGFNKDRSFIRKGGTGGWRDYFKGELENEVEQWMQENLIGYNELLDLFK